MWSYSQFESLSLRHKFTLIHIVTVSLTRTFVTGCDEAAGLSGGSSRLAGGELTNGVDRLACQSGMVCDANGPGDAGAELISLELRIDYSKA